MYEKLKNVRPNVSETLKSKEQSTDAPIIDADDLNIIWSAEAIKVASESLFYRTLACRPENEDALRGIA